MIGENAMKDSELIQKMHSGNKEAVSIIVERYYADIYRLGYLKISWDYIIDIFDKQYITDIFGAYVNNIKKFMEKY